MKIFVDGGCRGNGGLDPIGAAAAAFKTKSGKYCGWTRALLSFPTPTNQRAELTAIILGLELALQKFVELDRSPRLDVTLYSDSKYAIGCVTEWVHEWTSNGWTNANGIEVANRDLIEEAADLDKTVKGHGKLRYVWIPREQNWYADRICNECLDEL
ncbi:ribonuclease H-like domain-containing protein [Aspergillus aurantiobrunneus]